MKRQQISRKNCLHVIIVLGARPQIIKSAPFIHLATKSDKIHLEIVHTGQHYDYEMSRGFFDEFQLPDAVVNLEVGSGTHAWQTAQIMIRLEKILESKKKPNLIIVPGDTNSTLAGALVAAKQNIPIVHMEAGARSHDMSMPEEVNRRLTDHCSSLLFTPTANCTKNLLREGIKKKSIIQTGDTMYDILLQQLQKTKESKIIEKLGLISKNYALVTAHRPENVDNTQNLRSITNSIMELKNLVVIFPVHPRTKRQLKKIGIYRKLRETSHIKLIEPLGYLEILRLIQNAKVVLTDSGGLQKEAFWLHTPCVTFREKTEWVETISLKANYLTGANTEKILEAVDRIAAKGEKFKEDLAKVPRVFGDGQASQKMLEAIIHYH